MDMFKKARDRVMQTVGLTEKMPSNPRLVESAERLKQLTTLFNAMRRSVESYAGAMLAIGDASRALASDISQFYRSSPPRANNVALFTGAMVDQESNVLFLFKEQFGWDISREFDTWAEQSSTLRERTMILDNEYYQLNSDPRIDGRTAATKQQQLDTRAKTLEADIRKFVENRFARFDKVFIRLMEFQKEFFHEGIEVADKFDPVIKQFRDKVTLSGAPVAAPAPAAAATATTSAATNTSSVAITMKKSTHPAVSPTSSSVSSPVQSTSPVSDSNAAANATTAAAAAATKVSSNNTPSPKSTSPSSASAASVPSPVSTPTPVTTPVAPPTPVASKPAEFDLFGFSSMNPSQPMSSPASSNVASAPTHTSGPVDDLFGSLFSMPSATTSTKTSSTSTSTSHTTHTSDNSFDILGMSQTSSTNTRTTTTTTTASKPVSTGFDADFFSATSSASASATTTQTPTLSATYSTSSTSTRATSSIDDIDDDAGPSKSSSNGFDDDMLSGFTFKSSSTTNTNTSAASSFDMFDPLSSTPRSSTTTTQTSSFQHQELPKGEEMTESEEHDAIHAALSTIEPMIHNWRYKNGMEKETPALLASLTTVLWEGHNWKKVDITNLLDYNSVKKSYRRALITVHPDKVSGSTPLIKATSERIFEVLNNSFKQYEVKMGMRSAN